jgi:hypothetical protein
MRNPFLFLLLAACGTSSATAPPPQPEAGTDAGPACSAASTDGIQITPGAGDGVLDPLGYPPFAVDGCTLVYVTRDGELRARDLATATEKVLDPAASQPRRPTASGGTIAWQAVDGSRTVVRVLDEGAPITVSGPFENASEPRASADAIVFTGSIGEDLDVFLFTRATRETKLVAGGPGEQRFPDVSSTHVAVSDFSEDPSGKFSETSGTSADIVVIDRATGAKTTRQSPGKQAFPMLGAGGVLGYLDWGFVQPEPKLSAYVVKIGQVLGPVSADVNVRENGTVQAPRPYVRPSMRGGFIEWTEERGLYRRKIDLSTPVSTVLDGVDVLAPVAGDAMTIIATRQNDSFVLRGLGR